MNIFEALREDHDTQRRLIDGLLETHGVSGDRQQLFAELTGELAARAAADERHFHAPLMEHDPTQEQARHSVAELTGELAARATADERHFHAPLMEHDPTQEQARHSVAEHHELDELVERLEGCDMSAPAWIETARELGERSRRRPAGCARRGNRIGTRDRTP